jgi:hypothetical protein
MNSFWRGMWAVVLTTGILPVATRAGTSDVFRLQTTLRGVIQLGTISNGVTSKVIVTTDDLINLAQRRPLGTPVPKTEWLALTSDCPANNQRLIVFDAASASNLVTVGTLSNLTAAAFTRRRDMQTMTQITIADTSDGTNGITGGSFYYRGRLTITTNNCPVSFGGQIMGFLGTTFPLVITNLNCTNFVTCTPPATNCVTNCVEVCVTNCVLDGTTNIVPTAQTFNVIVSPTPLKTGKAIAVLIEDTPPEEPQPE